MFMASRQIPSGPGVSRRRFLGVGASLLASPWLGVHPVRAGLHLPAGRASTPPPTGSSDRPATYFVQEALVRGRAGLVARLDPDMPGRPFFELNLGGDEAALVHDCWDYVDIPGRMVDSLILVQEVVGADPEGEPFDLVLASLRAQQRPDGLFWNGPSPRPDGYAGDCVETFSQSRAALGLVTWLQSTGSKEAENALDALVDGLGAIAIWDGDAACFAGSQWRDGWLDTTLTSDGAPDGRAKYGWGAQVALPLTRYYELTRRPAAGRLVEALLRYFVERSGLVAADGSFAGHLHAEGYAPLAIAAVRYAIVAGRDDWLAWADRLFQWVRGRSTRYGWVPDRSGLQATYYRYWYGIDTLPNTCETCGLADAVELAIALAERGHPAYWDDVERWTRNHLLASQFGPASSLATRDSSASGADAAGSPPPPRALLAPSAQEGPLARVVAGAFDNASLPAGLLGFRASGLSPAVEGCCACSGLHGLFLAWQHAIVSQGGAVWVHLGISRDSPWAEIISYEPDTGRLDVQMHIEQPLRVRVPSWVPREALTLLVDEQPRTPQWDGDYLRFDALAPKQVVSLRYPLLDRTDEEHTEEGHLRVHWRGGTVVDVTPAGAGLDAYHRRRLAVAGPAPAPAFPRYSLIEW
jgi:hypothetical protein